MPGRGKRAAAAAALCVLVAALLRGPAGAYAAPEGARYALHVTVGRGNLDVDGTMTFSRGGRTGSELLILSEHMHELRVGVVEPGGTETPAFASVEETRDGQTRWVVEFPGGAPDTVTLHVHCTGDAATGLMYSLDGPTAFAAGVNAAWYPQLPDQPSGTGTVRYSVFPSVVVAGTGTEVDDAAQRAAGTFVFRHDAPASFAFAVAHFSVVRATVGGKPVAAYLLRPRANATEYLARCATVLAYLEREFGPYRYGGFTLIEVPDEQATAAGFSGASIEGAVLVTSSFLDAPFNTAFFGHEISHQWWGNLVRLRGDAGDNMLDEAMAQYGSLQAVRVLDGAQAAEQYRRSGYPGYVPGQSAQGYFDLAAAGLDHALDDLAGAQPVAHDLADSKGFLVLDLLAQSVGRERFRTNLAEITRAHAFGTITWPEFLATATAGSTVDLGSFSAQWLRRTGAPSFELAWEQRADRLEVVVTQPEPAYDAPLTLALTGTAGQTTTSELHVHGARSAFILTVPFRVAAAELDPHYDVLRWTAAMRAAAAGRIEGTRRAHGLR